MSRTINRGLPPWLVVVVVVVSPPLDVLGLASKQVPLPFAFPPCPAAAVDPVSLTCPERLSAVMCGDEEGKGLARREIGGEGCGVDGTERGRRLCGSVGIRGSGGRDMMGCVDEMCATVLSVVVVFSGGINVDPL
jgi:hypothetical protein